MALYDITKWTVSCYGVFFRSLIFHRFWWNGSSIEENKINSVMEPVMLKSTYRYYLYWVRENFSISNFVTRCEKPDLQVRKSKFRILTGKNCDKFKEFLKYSSDITEHDFNKTHFREKPPFFNLGISAIFSSLCSTPVGLVFHNASHESKSFGMKTWKNSAEETNLTMIDRIRIQ